MAITRKCEVATGRKLSLAFGDNGTDSTGAIGQHHHRVGRLN
jgi:hypothetical protein